jgi:AraC-like DNA-binding protein
MVIMYDFHKKVGCIGKNDYLCGQNYLIMEELRHLSLERFKQMLDQSNPQQVQHYISQNFAVARHDRVASFQSQFEGEPIVMDEMRILIVLQGSVKPYVNLVERHFQAHDIVFLGPNTLVQFKDASQDARGMGLSISDEFLAMLIGNNIPHAFDGHLRDFHFTLQPHEEVFLEHLHQMIYESVQLSSPNLQTTMMLISAFLWHIDGLWNSRKSDTRTAQSREQRVFADFMQLVARYATSQHHIDFYASQLCLSSRYMSAIIKKVSGKAAKQWIDDALVARIKVALRHTDKQMAQISDEMNFPNNSFFNKYFKRLTGLTPGQYRST